VAATGPVVAAATADAGSEINLRGIFASAPLGIFQSTLQKPVIVNPAMARMFGYDSPADMVASLSESIGLYASPAQRGMIIEEALKSETYVKREVQYRRKDGSLFLAQLYLRAARGGAETGVSLEGFVEDITERRQLEEEFRHAQKIEAIGQLAGGIAHDFNNILAATLLQLSLLLDDKRLTAGTRGTIKEVEAETLRAVNLTRQLLLFSRRQMARAEPLDVIVLIRELLKMLRRLLGENIQINFAEPAAAVWLNADAGMLEQVVTNLCINARDAMPHGGQLAISVTAAEFTADNLQGHPEARPGRFARLQVQDTGCGMAPPVLQRLFEPFFTTKEIGKGTGLGLATIYGIVKQHEGWIEVASTVGVGSTFQVYLPVMAGPLTVRPGGPEAEAARGGPETILLVEDDFSLRRTATLCLRKLGYAVLEAADGVAALALWRKHRDRIDLLFTDMVMPQAMTGLDLTKRLRTERPALKVIISSGYTTEQADLISPGSGITFLAKPYQHGHMAKLVRQCLDQKPQKTSPRLAERKP